VGAVSGHPIVFTTGVPTSHLAIVWHFDELVFSTYLCGSEKMASAKITCYIFLFILCTLFENSLIFGDIEKIKFSIGSVVNSIPLGGKFQNIG